MSIYPVEFVRGEHYSLPFYWVQASLDFAEVANGAKWSIGTGAPTQLGVLDEFYAATDTGTVYRHSGSAWVAQSASDIALRDLTNFTANFQVRRDNNTPVTLLNTADYPSLLTKTTYLIMIYVPKDTSRQLGIFTGRYELWLDEQSDTTKSFIALEGPFVVTDRIRRP